jgi:monovalent cation/hydrogen antiporter
LYVLQPKATRTRDLSGSLSLSWERIRERFRITRQRSRLPHGHGPNAERLVRIILALGLIYLIEGLVFLITGLQARTLIAHIGHYSIAELVIPAVVVSVVVIVTRFVWIYPATYLPRWIFPEIRRKDPSPPWQWPFALAFTGVRGIVSLAAALAIPFVTAKGEPFPDRDLILFLTFSVILVTLVGQGLILPAVIRALGLHRAGRREHHTEKAQEYKARREAIEAASERLDLLVVERGLSEEIVRPLRTYHNDRLKQIELRSAIHDGYRRLAELHDEIELALIAAARQRTNELFREGKLTDEARRRIERELDLREAHSANQRSEE